MVLAVAVTLALGLPAGADQPVAGAAPDGVGPLEECLTLAGFSERCPRWMAAYDHPSYTGPWGGEDVAMAMDVSPDGERVFVTGRSWHHTGSANGFDVATVAYDASSGEELWVARYDGPEGSWDAGFDIAAVDSSVVVAGLANEPASPFVVNSADFLTIAYDPATGEEQWSRIHQGATGGRDYARTLSVDEDADRVYVAGHQDHASAMVTIAYELSSGEEVWQATHEEPAAATNDAWDSVLSPDGRVLFVTGESSESPGGPFDFVTVAYLARVDDEDDEDEDEDKPREGTPLWVARTGDAGVNQRPVAIALDEESARVVVAGREDIGTEGDRGFLVVAYDMDTGAEAWQARFSDPSGTGFNDIADLAVAGGDAFVVGRTSLPLGNALSTVAYSVATGQERWRASYSHETDWYRMYAGSIALDPVREIVYSSGYSWGYPASGGTGTGTVAQASYLTIAYDARQGQRLWLARANSSPPAHPNGWDYGTVAYDTGDPG